MKRIIAGALASSVALFLLAQAAFAAPRVIGEGAEAQSSVEAVYLEDGLVNLRLGARAESPGALVSLSMYGRRDAGLPISRTFGGEKYYLYYVDEAAAGEDGLVHFDFNVAVGEAVEDYIFVLGTRSAGAGQITQSLPPRETSSPARPSAPNRVDGGGSGGKGGGNASFLPPAVTPVPTLPPTGEPGFRDLPETHWAHAAVTSLQEKGIVTGDNGAVRPDDPVSREEFAAVLVRAAGLEEGSQAADETSSEWALPYLAALRAEGIMLGDDEGHFHGRDRATRQDTAALAARAGMKYFGLAESDEAAIARFADADAVADYARGPAAALAEAGVLAGYEDNTLRPNAEITRAEAFVMLARLLDLKK